MKYKVMCVRDRAVDAFSTPFFVRSVGEAVRSFSDEVNRKDDNNQIYKHPEDYDLYLISEFDSDTGLFSDSKPSMVAVGKDVSLS